MLIANSNLVPEWATWEEFRRLEAMGLTMYGQMTAGSWIYIGTQGILQGTYETFAAARAKRYGGTLAGRSRSPPGSGGMGGAQPLAATMNDGVVLGVEVDPAADRAPRSSTLPRRVASTISTRRLRAGVEARDRREGDVDRRPRQRGRRLPRARGGTRRRRRHRPDQRARSARRLRPAAA